MRTKLLLMALLSGVTAAQAQQNVVIHTKDGMVHSFKKSMVAEIVFYKDKTTGEGGIGDTTALKTLPTLYACTEADGYSTLRRLLSDTGCDFATNNPADSLRYTLFAPNDTAFMHFFADNAWGIRSYEELSDYQKNALMNALLYRGTLTPDALSGDETPIRFLEKNPDGGMELRYLPYDSPAIPHTYSAESEELGFDYWKRFRQPSTGGIWLMADGTTGSTPAWEKKRAAEAGLSELLPATDGANGFVLNGAALGTNRTVCSNGLFQPIDAVCAPIENMAEVIRANGRTDIFSRMMERFAVPVYNEELTAQAQTLGLIAENDSVFEKRYLSSRSQGNNSFQTTPEGYSYYLLSYDPGWNAYTNGRQGDAAAMFVPDDDVFADYFLPGGAGEYLMEAYAITPNTKENLLVNIDQIPLNIVATFVNNLMKASLTATTDCAIDTLLTANNGIVYVTKDMTVPTDLACVSAPAMVNKNLSIANWAIHADDYAVTNPGSAPLHSYFSTYLKAKGSRFSFFIPTNAAFSRYYDPASHTNSLQSAWRIYSFTEPVRGNLSTAGPTCTSYAYDPATGEITSRGTNLSASVRNNRLADILNSHIVVHEGDESATGILNGNEYFVTKAGNAIRVSNLPTGYDGNLTDRLQGWRVQGPWQMERDSACTVKAVYDLRPESTGYGNGMAYIIDRPLQHTLRSVYNILSDNNSDSENNPYHEFFALTLVDRDVLESVGVGADAATSAERENALNKYEIFTAENPCADYNVRFFNSYRYTVYVPTNEAMQQAYAAGLPTWDDVNQLIAERDVAVEANPDLAEEITEQYNARAQRMIALIINFVKYHFQYGSVYNDNNPIDFPWSEDDGHETVCIDPATKRFLKLRTGSDGNHSMYVVDRNGNRVNVDSERCNIQTRDIKFSTQPTSASATIETSSFAVIHQIDGYLNFIDQSKFGSFSDMLNYY